MNNKDLTLILVVLLLVGVVAYLLLTQEAPKVNDEFTNHTNITEESQVQTNQSTGPNLSASEAESMAEAYMASKPELFANTEAGTPVLKDNVYDVPVVVTKENQHSVGTIVAYIKVDADTGRVYQIQERLMY